MTLGTLREATAPLLLLAGIAAAALIIGDVWLAAGTAALIGTGDWAAPPPDPALLVRLLRDGTSAVLVPGAYPPAFLAGLAAVLAVQAGGVVALARLVGRCPRTGDPRRALLRAPELGDLAGTRAVERARRLRPTAAELPPGGRGLRLLTVDRHEVWMSWEDVALVIMGPRANKTSALAVPAVLAAPGCPEALRKPTLAAGFGQGCR